MATPLVLLPGECRRAVLRLAERVRLIVGSGYALTPLLRMSPWATNMTPTAEVISGNA